MDISKNYYKRVIDTLLPRIRAGMFESGQQVPSTQEMADELNMAKHTVIYAYNIMDALGYLESRAGKGTYVTQNALSAIWTHNTLFTIPLPDSADPPFAISPPVAPQRAIDHLKLEPPETPLKFGRDWGSDLHELYYIHPQFEIHIAPERAPVDEYLSDEWGIPVERKRYEFRDDRTYLDSGDIAYYKAGDNINYIEIAAYTLNMKPLYWGLQAWGIPLSVSMETVRNQAGEMIIEQVNVNLNEK